MGIAFLQVFLGISVFTLESMGMEKALPMVMLTVAHVAVGALTLATSVVLAIQIRRNVCKPAPEEEEGPSPRAAAS
jgi:heme A synthase